MTIDAGCWWRTLIATWHFWCGALWCWFVFTKRAFFVFLSFQLVRGVLDAYVDASRAPNHAVREDWWLWKQGCQKSVSWKRTCTFCVLPFFGWVPCRHECWLCPTGCQQLHLWTCSSRSRFFDKQKNPKFETSKSLKGSAKHITSTSQSVCCIHGVSPRFSSGTHAFQGTLHLGTSATNVECPAGRFPRWVLASRGLGMNPSESDLQCTSHSF